MIRIENLSYKYEKAEEKALQELNLAIPKGSSVVIMGPTGAGKTTLILTLNGIIPQFFEGTFEGKVLVNDLNTTRYRVQTLTRYVGVVLQDPDTQIFGITVKDDVAFGPSNLGMEKEEILKRIKEALRVVRMEGYEDRITGELSGGEKQRLAVAGVLAMKPLIYALDEPTSELDPLGRGEIFDTLRRLQRDEELTTVLVEHSSEDVSDWADEVVVLNQGNIAWRGLPQTLFTDGDLTERLGVKQPPVSRLGWKLFRKGLIQQKDIPLNLDQAEKTIRTLVSARVRSRETVRQEDFERELQDTSGEGIQAREETQGKGETIIEAKNLTHVYPNGIVALTDVNLKIERGDFVALVGQNGAGKTTLVKHFNGLLRPTQGKAVIQNQETTKCTIGDLARTVGYVFQNPDHQIFSSSVKDEISYGLRNLGLSETEINSRTKEALSFVGLEGKEDSHPLNLGKGERQKLAVASILAMQPEVIIIDEPTTGLDWRGALQMMEMVKQLHQQGHTIILIGHDMNLVADYAHRVIVMGGGEILADGSPQEVFGQVEILKKAFLKPPQITQLAINLADLGFPNIINVDDMEKEVLRRVGFNHDTVSQGGR